VWARVSKGTHLKQHPTQRSTPAKFSYSRQQAEEIWNALKSAGVQEGVNKDHVIEQVTQAASSALTRRHFSSPTRYAGQIRKELENLSKAIDKFLKAFTLTPEAQSLLQAHFQSVGRPDTAAASFGALGWERIRLFIHVLLKIIQETGNLQAGFLQSQPKQSQPKKVTLGEDLSLLSPEVQKTIKQKRKQKPTASFGFPHRGAPINRPQEIFGLSLCAIYFEVTFEVTGRLPKPKYDVDKEIPSGPFYRWVGFAGKGCLHLAPLLACQRYVHLHSRTRQENAFSLPIAGTSHLVSFRGIKAL